MTGRGEPVSKVAERQKNRGAAQPMSGILSPSPREPLGLVSPTQGRHSHSSRRPAAPLLPFRLSSPRPSHHTGSCSQRSCVPCLLPPHLSHFPFDPHLTALSIPLLFTRRAHNFCSLLSPLLVLSPPTSQKSELGPSTVSFYSGQARDIVPIFAISERARATTPCSATESV